MLTEEAKSARIARAKRHAAADMLVAGAYIEARATMPSGCEVVGPDFHAYAKVNAVCDKNIAAARDRLVAAARKLGLAPVGAPDISYGVHGGWDGPVTLWYQMRAQ